MFTLTEEQTMLKDAATGFAADRTPVALLRKLRDSGANGHDQAIWQEMVNLGWTGVLVSEDHGGVDMGMRAMGVVLEALGSTIAPSPLFQTALIGASALKLAGSAQQQATWLPKIAAGEVTMALAVDEDPHHRPDRIKTVVTNSSGKAVLNGTKRFVPDGATADVLIVVASRDGEPALVLVDRIAAGVEVTPLSTVDSHPAGNVMFKDVEVPADRILAGGQAVVDQLLDRARVGAASMMLGAAQAGFDMTADYLKTRTQFGSLIGSFQSLQHRAALMLTDLELTRSAVIAAQAGIDSGRNDTAELASLAKARAADTLHLVSNETVQFHGGIGVTDAHDAGLYLKRARVLEALYGGAGFHRDRYARLLGF
jgi:alkylation response protein AidB-like acyl-CoA dehydrogenase